MPQPKPSSSLDNSCSVIHDNTLYVYTPKAFQSIKLEEGAEWEELESGESVEGATCIGQDQVADNAGFWVIGGAGSATGMAKYTYSTSEWTYPAPRDDTLKDRQYHSSVYMKAIDEVLVYAGTKDGSAVPTMETFSIQLNEPYGVSGHAGNTPNAIKPILLAWSDADALMVGGDPANTKVYLFNPDAGWRDFGANLAEPITKDYTQLQAALISGEDGSQNIYMFDMSASPNQVSRVQVQDASGAPVANAATITERGLVSRQDDGDWPSYNDTLAPTETRSNFGIAQGDDGMVVLSGGSDEEPIAMFNGMENKWYNATNELTFDVKAKTVSSETSTSTTSTSSSTSSSATSTSTSSEASSTTISSVTSETTAAETSEAAASSDNSDDDGGGGLGSNVILGITLGSIFAFLIILAALLFCLRRKKMQRNKAAAAAAADRGPSREGPITDEKDPNVFGNAPPPGPPPISPGHFRGHNPQNSAESYSSMAILMGRMNQQKGLSRKGSNDSRNSIVSHHRHLKSTISKPIPRDDSQPILGERGVTFDPDVPGPQPRSRNLVPDNQEGPRRSSGWNRYWSGGSSLQILGFGGKRNTSASDGSGSHYSQASNSNPNRSRETQDSATVPPLNFEARHTMNRVNSGSPVVTGGASKLPFSEGVSGKIERPTSRGSSAGYSSGIPESVNEIWDPTEAGNTKSWGHDRAPSSAYNSGFNFGQPMKAPPQEPPTGVSSQPQLAMASKSSDMSWLNLGDQNRDRPTSEWPAYPLK